MTEDYVYSSVKHMNLNAQNWARETEKLVTILQTEPNHAFILSRDLTVLSGFPTSGTQIQMRQAIARLVENDGVPIISSHNGYAIADQPSQVERCIRELQQRQDGIQRRMDALQKIKTKMETEL